MPNSKPLQLSLNSGYSLINDHQWPQYYLLDAEEKVRDPRLQAQEVKINRGKNIPDNDSYVASWPLIAEADLGDIIAKQIQLGRESSQRFRRIPLKIRVQILERFGQRLKEKAAYWRRLTIQEGYSYNAFLASFDAVLEIFKPEYLQMIQKVLSPQEKLGSNARIEYSPYGVIGVISPQNSSFPMLTQMLHGAFLSGNALLIKPPHRLAIVALAMVQEFNAFLKGFGLPDGLFSTVVHGNTEAIMEHWLGLKGGQDKIDNLIFVGNSARRDSVIQSCQKGLIFNPIIELEGVDAAYVHDDLTEEQLAHVAELVAHAKNTAAGQLCISLKRLYVQSGVYQRFMPYLKTAFEKYHPGSLSEDDAYILGPSGWAAKLTSLVKAFEENGASVLTGGRRLNFSGKPDPKGNYIEPTLIENVDPGDALLCDEIFANILPVVKLDCSVREAVDWINQCPFGLRASIFAQSPEVLEMMSDGLRVGTIVMNGSPLDCSIQIAGGRGLSTLDQHARIWPIDMSLRKVVTSGQNIKTLDQIMNPSNHGAASIWDTRRPQKMQEKIAVVASSALTDVTTQNFIEEVA